MPRTYFDIFLKFPGHGHTHVDAYFELPSIKKKANCNIDGLPFETGLPPLSIANLIYEVGRRVPTPQAHMKQPSEHALVRFCDV